MCRYPSQSKRNTVDVANVILYIFLIAAKLAVDLRETGARERKSETKERRAVKRVKRGQSSQSKRLLVFFFRICTTTRRAERKRRSCYGNCADEQQGERGRSAETTGAALEPRKRRPKSRRDARLIGRRWGCDINKSFEQLLKKKEDEIRASRTIAFHATDTLATK